MRPFPHRLAPALATMALALLAGCDLPGGTGSAGNPGVPGSATPVFDGEGIVIADGTNGPPDARPGACYGRDQRPATIETVTERELVAEAEIGAGGTIISPARYETRRSERIIEGETLWFETPCPPRWTSAFIASVQRALSARGFYAGEASGTLDSATRRAIRAYQVTQGLNSDILSTDNARRLGLVEVDLG